jgi:hypothetical protein
MGRLRLSSRFFGDLLPGLGPPRPAQPRAFLSKKHEADGFTATVSAAVTTQRGGLAVSRLEGCGISLGVALESLVVINDG